MRFSVHILLHSGQKRTCFASSSPRPRPAPVITHTREVAIPDMLLLACSLYENWKTADTFEMLLSFGSPFSDLL